MPVSLKIMKGKCMTRLLAFLSKKAQCSAFVGSSGNGRRCDKTVRWGLGNYCWWHTPKKSIAIVAILSALGGFAAKSAGGWLAGKLFESPELRATRHSRETIVQHQDVLAELASELHHLNFTLIFRDDASFKLKVGQMFMVSLTEGFNSRSRREFEVLVEVTNIGRGPNENPFNVYRHSRSRIGPSNEYVRSMGYDAAAFHWPIAELPVPLAIGPNDPSPFQLVRDLDNFHVQVLIPAALAPSVDGIEIIANSNVGLERGLKLFTKRVDPKNWAEMDYDVKQRFWGKGISATERIASIRDAKVEMVWAIDIRDAVWEERSVPPSWEGFRFEYRNH